jgi:hypothetical protein
MKKSQFSSIFFPDSWVKLPLSSSMFVFFFVSVDERFASSGFEGSVVQVSDQGLRKVLYQKVGIFSLLVPSLISISPSLPFLNPSKTCALKDRYCFS